MQLSAPIHQLKRRAKSLARREHIPLHEALNRIANEEGFSEWSLLSSKMAGSNSATDLLANLNHGDMLLIGARPRHGKTLLGMRLLLEAAFLERKTFFFTLEFTGEEANALFEELDDRALSQRPEVIASDDIYSAHIIEHLADEPSGTVALIDYLQILDQKRTTPPLFEQMEEMRKFAVDKGHILCFIAQVDRSFDAEQKRVPDFVDVRLPNPISRNLFSKACFTHNGKTRIQSIA